MKKWSDYKDDIKTPIGKLQLIGGILLIFTILVLVGIIRMISGEEGEQWRRVGKTLHVPKIVPIAPVRGRILSSDGRPLAVTAPSERLYLDFRDESIKLVYDKSVKPADSVRYREKKHLSDSLSHQLDLLADQLYQMYNTPKTTVNKKALRARWQKAFQKKGTCELISKDITYLERLELESHGPLAPVPRKKKKGTEKSLIHKLLSRPKDVASRLYPFAPLARRTIGTLRKDKEGQLSVGENGLEAYYNDVLAGKPGEELSKYSGRVQTNTVITPAIDGADIYTSIDMNIQRVVDQIHYNQLSALDAERGTVILMEVKTGRIVAMSNLSRQKEGIYTELENIAVTDRSEPGSTFKIASMMIALDDGICAPTDTIDVGNGVWKVGDRNLHDHNSSRGGYGRITASQVIQYSSNVGIAKIITKGYAKRPEVFIEKLRALGFNKPIGIDLKDVGTGWIKKPSDNPAMWSATSLAWISHGYETAIPPIYTVTLYNAIANGGRMMAPHFGIAIDRHDGQREEIAPKVLNEAICKPSTITALKEMMRLVVEKGTGKSLRNDVVNISGKSGTAKLPIMIRPANSKTGEKALFAYRDQNGRGQYQVSFCGFFPSENPKYTCISVIRKPRNGGHPGGGSMAGPIVRDIAIALMAKEQPLTLDKATPTIAEAKAVNISSGLKRIVEQPLSANKINLKGQGGFKDSDYISIDNKQQVAQLPPVKAGIIPDLIGMSATDATYRLLSLGYIPEVIGFGNVIEQSVPYGKQAPKGTKVRIRLGY